VVHAAGELNQQEYNVTGCGQSDYYSVQCSIFGICKVKDMEEIQEHNKDVEEDLRRMSGCQNSSTCIEHYGQGYVCSDYACVKE
jgi:hypothetical protein